MIRFHLPFRHLRKLRRLSEQEVGERADLSRTAIRGLESPESGNVTVGSVIKLAEYFERDVEILACPRDIFSEYSTIATSYKIERDGFDSWKIHLYDFVDEFRRTVDPRLILLPPPASSDQRIIALLSSVVRELCSEVRIATPMWASHRCFLPTPWFVSGMNSLKASAILESPLAFRANNIFVHENFLTRV